MLRLLRNKDFSILLTARFLSSMGNSFYTVSAMWLVFSLGGSSFYTGLALFLTSMPAILQLFLGPLIDRISIKRLLIFTQGIQVFLLLLIPLFSYLNILSVSLILAVMPLISLFNQFLYPAELSALPKLLNKEDLTKGNTLFYFAYQGSKAIFDAVAGFTLTIVSAVSLFYINSLTFVISMLVISAFTVPFMPQSKISTASTLKTEFISYYKDLKLGFKELKHKLVAALLTGIIFLNISGVAINAVLPDYASTGDDIGLYGLYLSASAVGLLLGAYIATLRIFHNARLGRLYVSLVCINGFLLIAFATSGKGFISVIIYGMAWVCTGMMNIFSQSLIQSITPKELIGRVMSAAMGLTVGLAPLGALAGGIIGSEYGNKVLIIGSAAIFFFIGLYWLLNKNIAELPSMDKISPVKEKRAVNPL